MPPVNGVSIERVERVEIRLADHESIMAKVAGSLEAVRDSVDRLTDRVEDLSSRIAGLEAQAAGHRARSAFWGKVFAGVTSATLTGAGAFLLHWMKTHA